VVGTTGILRFGQNRIRCKIYFLTAATTSHFLKEGKIIQLIMTIMQEKENTGMRIKKSNNPKI
jgi:hypothetical protein